MKLPHHIHKNSLLVIAAGTLLISATLISCGGSGGGGGGGSSDTIAGTNVPDDDAGTCVPVPDTNTNVPVASPVADVPKISSMPAFDLDGFKRCSDSDIILDLKVKTHVAFGNQASTPNETKFAYLFNQTVPVNIVWQTFGTEPLAGRGKSAYCKPVAANNNDIAVFNSALVYIKAHIEGKQKLTSAEILVQNERLKQTMYGVVESKEALLQAFSVIAAYEKMRGGALFLNKETKNGFPNEYLGDDDRDIDRTVLTLQQGIHNTAFTPANFAKYKDVLTGRKFNSANYFPGKVKAEAKADPCKSYSVNVNATVPKDLEIRTAYSQYTVRRPTGYYLAAGDVARVTVPASMVNKGFTVQVGAHIHDKSIKSTIMRPYQVTNIFPITNTMTEIANPNGGGIYINVPYLADVGKSVLVKIKNAVPAPLFSATELNKTTLQQWKETQRNNPAPWADFASDKYMMTVPTSWIYKYEDPVALMKDWDNRMDVVSDLLGHNKMRNNYVMYNIIDTSFYSDQGGIGYPYGNNGAYNPYEATDGNKKYWMLEPGLDSAREASLDIHELGHAELAGGFDGESEAFVNLLYVAITNRLYKNDIDAALGESRGRGSKISRNQAAIHWMVTPNFRDGKPMDISNSEKNEVRYQERGHAKYVEVAALFGWDKLDKFYLEENRVHANLAVDAGKGLENTDSRILRMSIAAGVDLTPLIHFWGVQPVQADKLSAAIKAAGLKPSKVIYDRIKSYKNIIPMDNASFQLNASIYLNKPVSEIKAAQSLLYGEGWHYFWLNKYSTVEGQEAQVALDNILKKYFPAGVPAN